MVGMLEMPFFSGDCKSSMDEYGMAMLLSNTGNGTSARCSEISCAVQIQSIMYM